MAYLQFFWLVLLRCLRREGPGSIRLFYPRTVIHYHRLPWLLYREIFVNRCYDPPVPLPTHPRILSIGANIGLGALYFLNRYPDARLTSVEPNPEAFRLLEINLASARFPQASIRLDRRAVAAEDGEVEFVIPKKNRTAVFASVNGIRTSGLEVDTLTVPCVALNRLISEKVDLLKLDIEGFEYEVLDQAEINAQKVSSLIIEFHDREKNGQKCAAILNRLVNEQGYRLSDAHGKSIDVRTFCQGPGAALAKLTA